MSVDELLAYIDQELAAGAAPSDMRGMLRLAEFVEPIEESALAAINRRLSHRPSTARSRKPESVTEPTSPPPQGLAVSPDPPEEDPLATMISATPEEPDPAPLEQSEPEASRDITQPIVVDQSASPADSPARTPAPAPAPVDPVPSATVGTQVIPPDAIEPPVMEPSAARLDGLVNGRYRLLELIASSSASDIYKATDVTLADSNADRDVVVKMMSRAFVESVDVFAGLQNYIRRLAGLHHPNIARFFECGRDGTAVYFTMEFLSGESLLKKLGDNSTGGPPAPLSGDLDARATIATVARALQFLHQNSVVHGHLKPGNILLTTDQTVKLCGFDIPNWVGRPKTASERRETAGTRLSATTTPQYWSPQITARQRPEVSDDVYALACIAYRLLTGWHPFDDGTGAQTWRFPPPERPGLTTAEYSATVKALQFERSARTQSVSAFIEEFETAIRPRPTVTRWAWAGAAAVLLTVAAIGTFVHFRRENTLPVITEAPVVPRHTEVTPIVRPEPPKPGSSLRDCPDCPPMTVLASGHFLQGEVAADGTAAPRFEQPKHAVTIGYTFAMSTNDVTVAEFSEFAAASGHQLQGCDIYDGKWQRDAKASWQDPGFSQSPQHPVTCVSWNDAVEYAQWLSTKSGHHYRLPSASEWEYAARAGADAATPWGSDAAGACADANVADASADRRYPGWQIFPCNDGNIYTAAVGSYKPNGFGLDDMLGNVFVWTQDCWHGDYNGAPANGSARMDKNCGDHEMRGGSWFSSPRYVTAAYRNHFAAGYRTSSVGMRLVRELDQ